MLGVGAWLSLSTSGALLCLRPKVAASPSLTNLLYGSRLTDMATAYKVFRSEVVKGLRLKSARFEIEPEVTAKLLLSGHGIVEVPIAYNPRSHAEGKKIGWVDAVQYVITLVTCRIDA